MFKAWILSENVIETIKSETVPPASQTIIQTTQGTIEKTSTVPSINNPTAQGNIQGVQGTIQTTEGRVQTTVATMPQTIPSASNEQSSVDTEKLVEQVIQRVLSVTVKNRREYRIQLNLVRLVEMTRLSDRRLLL